MPKYKNCLRVCVSLCRTVVHNTAQSNSDYLPSYPPDKHQSSDAVYWRGGGLVSLLIASWSLINTLLVLCIKP